MKIITEYNKSAIDKNSNSIAYQYNMMFDDRLVSQAVSKVLGISSRYCQDFYTRLLQYIVGYLSKIRGNLEYFENINNTLTYLGSTSALILPYLSTAQGNQVDYQSIEVYVKQMFGDNILEDVLSVVKGMGKPSGEDMTASELNTFLNDLIKEASRDVENAANSRILERVRYWLNTAVERIRQVSGADEVAQDLDNTIGSVTETIDDAITNPDIGCCIADYKCDAGCDVCSIDKGCVGDVVCDNIPCTNDFLCDSCDFACDCDFEEGCIVDIANECITDDAWICVLGPTCDCPSDVTPSCDHFCANDHQCGYDLGYGCGVDESGGRDCNADLGYGCGMDKGYDCGIDFGHGCGIDLGHNCSGDLGCTGDLGWGCGEDQGLGCGGNYYNPDCGYDRGNGCGLDTGLDCGYDFGNGCFTDYGAGCGSDWGYGCGADYGYDCGTDLGFDCGSDLGHGCSADIGYDCGYDCGGDAVCGMDCGDYCTSDQDWCGAVCVTCNDPVCDLGCTGDCDICDECDFGCATDYLCDYCDAPCDWESCGGDDNWCNCDSDCDTCDWACSGDCDICDWDCDTVCDTDCYCDVCDVDCDSCDL